MGLLNKYYGISVAVETERTDECGRWAEFIRSYLYPYSGSRDAPEGEFVGEYSQWYVNRTKRYGFSVKGGTNNEPHNHNDVGSFIIADEGGQLLCDIGMGEYTRDYFNGGARYDYLCNSSLGHSVPIIDGRGQLAGAQYRADAFEAGGGRARVSFGCAYGGGISVTREFKLGDDKITMRGEYAFSDGRAHTVTERFVSFIKPEPAEGYTIIGSLVINKTGEIRKEMIRAHDG